jgi:NTP pyrophosphatase (non-canonical NTP hydrolase)
MIDWPELQKEVGEWSVKNFGTQPPERRILGMIEELGELAHCVVKQEQKIRTNTSTMQKEWDAVGDLIIYMLDFCYSINLDLSSIIQQDDNRTALTGIWTAPLIFDVCKKLGVLAELESNGDKLIQLDKIVLNLKIYCIAKDFNFESVVQTTWDKVKQRNWHEFPNDGVSR